jgi:hypothetical protein
VKNFKRAIRMQLSTVRAGAIRHDARILQSRYPVLSFAGAKELATARVQRQRDIADAMAKASELGYQIIDEATKVTLGALS